jgi:hypothetical protein
MFRRALMMLALLATLSGAANFKPAEGWGVCAESCPDDDANHQCAPGCGDCGCCVARPPMLPAASGILVVEATQQARAMPINAGSPSSPDPKDIPHVPIAWAS